MDQIDFNIKVDNLTLALMLICKAKDEKQRLEDYIRDIKTAEEKDELCPNWGCKEVWKVMDDYTPLPTKTHIKNLCKEARKLLALTYKDLEKEI